MEITCPKCDGDGTYPDAETCWCCAGTGIVELIRDSQLKGETNGTTMTLYMVWETLLNKLEAVWARRPATNVIEAYKILEATDVTEYGDLSDTNKTGYNMLISCGFADLNDGTQAKTNLWSWFDSESTTRANLFELIT